MPTRKNAHRLTPEEEQRFISTIEALVANGSYGTMVEHHTRMRQHRMHSFSGPVGAQRFLPWHRAYLYELERMMIAIDGAAFIPYWDWTISGVPGWMTSFRPEVTVNGTARQANRDTVGLVSNAAELSRITSQRDYDSFTRELENGPHNRGHNMIGGVMSTMASPTDPMFFMHHAEVDRQWEAWLRVRSGQGPTLTGVDRTMDPWTHNVDQLNVASFRGVIYDVTPTVTASLNNPSLSPHRVAQAFTAPARLYG